MAAYAVDREIGRLWGEEGERGEVAQREVVKVVSRSVAGVRSLRNASR